VTYVCLEVNGDDNKRLKLAPRLFYTMLITQIPSSVVRT